MFFDGDDEISREETIERLVARDGLKCQFDGCTRPFDEIDKGNHILTIDHHYPQAVAREEGWTHERINQLSNLKLMGKSCNARKGNAIPDENGKIKLNGRVKAPKVPRPGMCDLCMNGRLLLPGEECELCGSDAQPKTFPRTLQLQPKECRANGHRAPYHCWVCALGWEEQQPASEDVFYKEEV